MLEDIVLYNDGTTNHYSPQAEKRLRKIADWYPNPYTNVFEKPQDVDWLMKNLQL
jgi:hypothetical protein